MCVVLGGDGWQPGCPGLAGHPEPSVRDDACTVGYDAPAGEPEALGLNHQGVGPALLSPQVQAGTGLSSSGRQGLWT